MRKVTLPLTACLRGYVIISLHCNNTPSVSAFYSNVVFFHWVAATYLSFLIGLLNIAHLWKLLPLNCPNDNGLRRLQAHWKWLLWCVQLSLNMGATLQCLDMSHQQKRLFIVIAVGMAIIRNVCSFCLKNKKLFFLSYANSSCGLSYQPYCNT